MAQSISMRSLAAIVQRWVILLVSAWALTVRANSGDDPGVRGLVATDLSTNATAVPYKVQKLLNDSTRLEKNSSKIVDALPSGAGASNEATTSSNGDDGDDRSNAGLTAPPNTEIVATTPTAVTPLLAEKEDSTSKSKELPSGNNTEIVANVTTPAAPLSFLQAIFQAKLARSEAAENAQSESDQLTTKDYKGVFVLSATAVKSSTTPSAGAAASKSFEKEDLGVDGLKESTTSASSFTRPKIAANGVNGATAVPVRRDARPITHPLWRNARGKGLHDEDEEQSTSNPLRVRVHFFLQILDTHFYALSLWKCVQCVSRFYSNPIRCRCTQSLSRGLHHQWIRAQLGTDLRRASMPTTLLFLRKCSKAFVW